MEQKVTGLLHLLLLCTFVLHAAVTGIQLMSWFELNYTRFIAQYLVQAQ